MKRALIGGWLALLGTLWNAGILYAASQMLVSSWNSRVGRLMTTILECGLTLPLVISVLFLLSGLLIMGVEFFKKD